MPESRGNVLHPGLQAHRAERKRDPANLPDGTSPGLDADAWNDCDVFTFPDGCHAAEVEIDLETGAVTLERYTAIDDYGRLINPMLIPGQVQGASPDDRLPTGNFGRSDGLIQNDRTTPRLPRFVDV